VAELTPESPKSDQKKTVEEQLLEQYDLGDSSFDPDLDAAPEPLRGAPQPGQAGSGESSPASAAPSLPPRDEQGRFLPRREASQRQLSIARNLGFSDEELQDVDADVLEERIVGATRALRSYQGENRSLGERQSSAGSLEGGETAEAGAQEDEDVDIEERESIHDPILHTLDRYNRRLKALEAIVAQQQQSEQRRANETAVETADRVIFARYPHIYGAGTLKDIKAESRDHDRRRAVWARAQKEQGTLEERFEKAHEYLYGGLGGEAEEGEPPARGRQAAPRRNGYTAEEWAEAGTAVPTQREGAKEPKGTRRAEKGVRDYLRRTGLSLDETGPEEAGLPD
jgi:hypothetical protein